MGQVNEDGEIQGKVPMYIKEEGDFYPVTVLLGTFVELDNLTTAPGIPETVEYIAGMTFAWTGLTSITIPNNVTCIDFYAIGWCDYLEDVYFEHTTELPTFEGTYFVDTTRKNITFHFKNQAMADAFEQGNIGEYEDDNGVLQTYYKYYKPENATIVVD